jgi:hypothetical protein
MLVMGRLKYNERTSLTAEALTGRLEEILIFEILKDGYVERVGYRRLHFCVLSVSCRRLICARYFPFL